MWIELHQSLVQHKKMDRLVRETGLGRDTALGRLCMLWLWALADRPDGELSDLTPARAGEILFLRAKQAWSFLEALERCGFLDREGESLRVHDWKDYAGRLMEARARDRERKRRDRAALRAASAPLQDPCPVADGAVGAGPVPARRSAPDPDDPVGAATSRPLSSGSPIPDPGPSPSSDSRLAGDGGCHLPPLGEGRDTPDPASSAAPTADPSAPPFPDPGPAPSSGPAGHLPPLGEGKAAPDPASPASPIPHSAFRTSNSPAAPAPSGPKEADRHARAAALARDDRTGEADHHTGVATPVRDDRTGEADRHTSVATPVRDDSAGGASPAPTTGPPVSPASRIPDRPASPIGADAARTRDYLRARGLDAEVWLGPTPELRARCEALARDLFQCFADRCPTLADRAKLLPLVTRLEPEGRRRWDEDRADLLRYAFEQAALSGAGGSWPYIEGVLQRSRLRKIGSLGQAEDYEWQREA